jgi:hypothetical protein
MTSGLSDSLPQLLKSVRTRPLFVMRFDVRPIVVTDPTPVALRRIGIVPGGTFEGERLKGQVLDGGNDWQSVRNDGSTWLDVRLILRTYDGANIAMTYQGVRHGPPDVIARIEKGEVLDPSTHYFRINPVFETASEKYHWMNRILAIGSGHGQARGPIYSVFEVL